MIRAAGPDLTVAAFGDIDGLRRLLEELPDGWVTVLIASELRADQLPALAGLACRRGLELLVQPRATREASVVRSFVERLQDYTPDLIVVDSYSLFLPAAVRVIAGIACLNIHGALLPGYRGPNPIQWALINDERRTGVTLHLVDDGFDTGDIVAQFPITIAIDDTWRDVQAAQDKAARTLINRSLPRYLAGELSAEPQASRQATQFRRRAPADGLINWDHTVLDIHNLIRALVAPLPGAFYLDANGRKTVIDHYLSLDEVLELKFGAAGARSLVHGDLVLIPATLDSARSATVALRIHRRDSGRSLGRLCLLDIDWNARVTAVACDIAHDDMPPLIARLLRETGLTAR